MVDYRTELFYDDTWNDITPDVRDSAPITMVRGRRDWASETDPATLALTLNNGPSNVVQGVQGRYSPRNPRSDLFGKIGRNTPIRVREEGSLDSWLETPGIEGSYAATPDKASLDITGDIDIRLEIDPGTRNGGTLTDVHLISKYIQAGDERSWIFNLLTDGTLQFRWSEDGTFGNSIAGSSTESLTEPIGRLAVRVTLDVDDGAGGYILRFWTSDSIDGTWTQLGNDVTDTGTTNIYASTTELSIGSAATGISQLTGVGLFRGRIYAAQVLDGIDGTLVVDADFTDQEPEDRSMTDAEGNVFTLNGNDLFVAGGVRFTGELKSWPMQWDLSGADRWVQATAAGITRRLQKGSKPVKSSLLRDLSTRTGVVAYYPLEAQENATRFASGLPEDSTFLTPAPAGEVQPAADSETFAASAPLPTVSEGRIDGRLPSYSASSQQRFSYLLSVPASLSISADTIVSQFRTTGTTSGWWVVEGSIAGTYLQVFDDDGMTLLQEPVSSTLIGFTGIVSLLLEQDGSDIDWTLSATETDGTVLFTESGSLAGETLGRFTFLSLGSSGTPNDLGGSTFGHPFVLDDNVDAFDDVVADSLDGWAGETVQNRLYRLGADEDLPIVRVVGVPDEMEELGAQLVKTLVDLFQEGAAADLGILIDRRDALGLQFRSRSDLYVNEPVLFLDYASGMIADPFRPVDDDQAIVNDVTVTRVRGGSAAAEDTSGPLSTQDPPDGVGRYDVSQEINVAEDSRLPDQAHWRLRQGTVDEMRFPELTLNLRNPRVAQIEADVLAVNEGDRIRITNPPVWLPGGPYDLFVEAIREEKTSTTHEITFTCSPGNAWNVGVFDADSGVAESRYSSQGTTLTEDLTTTETSIDIDTPLGPKWGTADLPYDVMIGGERMTVTAVSGTDDAQTITVTRSVNGVVKTHASGAEMALYKPTYYAL